jgi:hypothetical protein
MGLLQIENHTDLKEDHQKWIEAALKESGFMRESK